MSASYINYGRVNILWYQPTGTTAFYKTLRAHWLGPNPLGINLSYYPPGAIITEGIDIPFGWIPTLAVDPLNDAAAAKFWGAGPRDLAFAASNDLNLVEINNPPEGMLLASPVTYWQQLRGFTPRSSVTYVNYGRVNISGGVKLDPMGPNIWVLTGLGAGLPARGP